MHWSLSTHTLFDAFIYGLIFVPATAPHLLVNYISYSI